jgi:hypothetical protein
LPFKKKTKKVAQETFFCKDNFNICLSVFNTEKKKKEGAKSRNQLYPFVSFSIGQILKINSYFFTFSDATKSAVSSNVN